MALIVVVHFICTLLAVGLLVLILRIFEALVERVLALQPVEVTGLEGLVVVLREALAILAVMLVGMIVTVMIVVVATNVFLVIVLMMQITTLVAAIVPVVLVCKIANLVIVALCHLAGVYVWHETQLFLMIFLSEPSATCKL